MKHLTALLIAALALSAKADVQILPFGEFSGRDGRPGKDLKWKLGNESGAALAKLLNAKHGKVRFNLDYDHQTFRSESNGQPAPASGWGNTFEWRDNDGLYLLDVKWTARAKAMIDADEYSYISPVIVYDKKTGEIVDVINASLVNIPNLEMHAVAEEQLARMNALDSTFINPQEKPEMKLLLALLGLAATATEDEAIAAVNALKSGHQATLTALNTALGLKPEADVDAATSAIATLKTQSATGDKTTQATIATLQAQVAQLSAAQAEREVNALVDQALVDGKLLPAQKAWAINLGKASLANLQSFLKDAPKVAASLSQQQSNDGAGDAEDKSKAKLGEAELAMCNAMGLTPEQFAKAAA